MATYFNGVFVTGKQFRAINTGATGTVYTVPAGAFAYVTLPYLAGIGSGDAIEFRDSAGSIMFSITSNASFSDSAASILLVSGQSIYRTVVSGTVSHVINVAEYANAG